MTVTSILMDKHSPLVSVRPGARVECVIDLMRKNAVGSVVVVSEAGRLEGIIVERDVLKAIDTHLSVLQSLQAKDIMSSRTVTCAPDDTEETLMKRMVEENVQHMPVIADGEAIAVISIEDLVETRVKKVKSLMKEIADAMTIERHLEYFTRYLRSVRPADTSSERWATAPGLPVASGRSH